MKRHLLTMIVALAAGAAIPSIGTRTTFKVDKFDIKGDGGTDYVAVEARRVACSFRAPRT